ncbi:NFATC2-interacting protein [Genypterus blacodes]|uniref:NFATC2-interacting protein n=1 Tax=Genypterus blacodes TaxID=154954 RepID=UPI003F75F559
MSDNDDVKEVHPPPKRRRIINPAAITSVPIYSNKVNMCLQLKPTAAVLAAKQNADDVADDFLWSPSSSSQPSVFLGSSDSEEEIQCVERNKQPDIRSPSPPPPTASPPKKVSRKASRMIQKINKQLGAARSMLTPSPESKAKGARNCRRLRSSPLKLDDDDDDDDLIIVTPASGPVDVDVSSSGGESPLTVREIPLKIRCRTVVHKIPVLSSAPLSEVVDQLSIKLKVPPASILLLRREIELPTHQTASELGLGIADFIDCVVGAADDELATATDNNNRDSNIITVRLQGKDRGSTQELSLHKDAPLGSILSQYLSRMPKGARGKARFHFDGAKVTHNQTPSQLDMEDGDVIEVWT